jgi:hypothetical protein
MTFSPEVCDLASDRDRDWFVQNPGRSHRVRPAHGGEFPFLETPADGWALIVCRQVCPGVRVRLSFYSTEFPPPDEDTARTLFDLLLKKNAR